MSCCKGFFFFYDILVHLLLHYSVGKVYYRQFKVDASPHSCLHRWYYQLFTQFT